MANFDYNDPIIYELKSGVYPDNFTQFTDVPYRVINNKILLSQLPVRANKVQIRDAVNSIVYSEIARGAPGTHQYYVDYTQGLIYLNDAANGKTLACSGYNRGGAFFPASRIYTQVDENGVITETLAGLIGGAQEAVENAIAATESANEAAESATDAALSANFAASTSLMIWKPYVNDYEDIATTYPNPTLGWTTQISTGERFRYDGTTWQQIGIGDSGPTWKVWIGSTAPENPNYLWIYDDELELLTSFYFGSTPPENPNLIWVET